MHFNNSLNGRLFEVAKVIKLATVDTLANNLFIYVSLQVSL